MVDGVEVPALLVLTHQYEPVDALLDAGQLCVARKFLAPTEKGGPERVAPGLTHRCGD